MTHCVPISAENLRVPVFSSSSYHQSAVLGTLLGVSLSIVAL